MRASALDAETALERAGSLVGLIAAEAGEAEAERRVTDAVMEAVAEADLFRLVVPTGLGGHGLDARTLVRVTRLFGRACPSTAWTLSFLMLHAWLVTKLPEAGREAVFAEGPTPFVPMALAPTGTAVPAEGGFVVRGRWEWATASAHADWFMVHAVVEGGGFETRFVVLRRDEVRIDDVWHTSGMRATSSNAVVLDDVFVPVDRTLPGNELDRVTGLEGDGMARLPMRAILALVASAPALGAAEAVVELYRERLAERVLAFTVGDRAVEQPAAQMRLGEVLDEVRTAAVRWDGLLDALEAVEVADLAQRADVRVAAAATVRRARRVIAMACEGAGASTYFVSNRMQRLQRDVEVIGGHVIFDWDRASEIGGRTALGLAPRPSDLI